MVSEHVIDFRHAPPSSWSCIGRPDDPYKTLVDERGRLLYEYERVGTRFGVYRFACVVEFALISAMQPLRISQHTPDARVPQGATQLQPDLKSIPLPPEILAAPGPCSPS